MLSLVGRRYNAACPPLLGRSAAVVATTSGSGATRAVFTGAGGPSSTSASATAAAMDRVAAKAARAGSAHSEEVQAERRAAFHRKQEERRKLVEKHSKANAGAPQRKTFTGAASIASDNAKPLDEPEEGEKPPPSLFATKLGTMHTDMFERRKDSNFSIKQERKAKVRMEERRKLLRFREVDDELDSLILKRDLFLWFTTLRNGMSDSIIDQMLERELRYYPEESNREVRYNPKLMTGLPYLSNGVSFPTLSAMTRLSSVSAMKDQEETDKLDDKIDKMDDVDAAQPNKAAAPTTGRTQHPHRLKSTDANAAAVALGGESTTAKKRLRSVFTGSGKDFGGVTVNKTTFPKPTLVTLSQFTYNTAVQQFDDLWVELLRPDTAPKPLDDDAPATASAKAVAAAQFTPAAFNVLRLKSFETSGTMWIKNIILSSFCRGLDLSIAQETVYADRITRNFMPSLGLRNFSTTYCFLVDTKGRIRWMSAGEPTVEEKKLFPTLLRELELETLRTQR